MTHETPPAWSPGLIVRAEHLWALERFAVARTQWLDPSFGVVAFDPSALAYDPAKDCVLLRRATGVFPDGAPIELRETPSADDAVLSAPWPEAARAPLIDVWLDLRRGEALGAGTDATTEPDPQRVALRCEAVVERAIPVSPSGALTALYLGRFRRENDDTRQERRVALALERPPTPYRLYDLKGAQWRDGPDGAAVDFDTWVAPLLDGLTAWEAAAAQSDGVGPALAVEARALRIDCAALPVAELWRRCRRLKALAASDAAAPLPPLDAAAWSAWLCEGPLEALPARLFDLLGGSPKAPPPRERNITALRRARFTPGARSERSLGFAAAMSGELEGRAVKALVAPPMIPEERIKALCAPGLADVAPSIERPVDYIADGGAVATFLMAAAAGGGAFEPLFRVGARPALEDAKPTPTGAALHPDPSRLRVVLDAFSRFAFDLAELARPPHGLVLTRPRRDQVLIDYAARELRIDFAGNLQPIGSPPAPPTERDPDVLRAGRFDPDAALTEVDGRRAFAALLHLALTGVDDPDAAEKLSSGGRDALAAVYGDAVGASLSQTPAAFRGALRAALASAEGPVADFTVWRELLAQLESRLLGGPDGAANFLETPPDLGLKRRPIVCVVSGRPIQPPPVLRGDVGWRVLEDGVLLRHADPSNRLGGRVWASIVADPENAGRFGLIGEAPIAYVKLPAQAHSKKLLETKEGLFLEDDHNLLDPAVGSIVGWASGA